MVSFHIRMGPSELVLVQGCWAWRHACRQTWRSSEPGRNVEGFGLQSCRIGSRVTVRGVVRFLFCLSLEASSFLGEDRRFLSGSGMRVRTSPSGDPKLPEVSRVDYMQ